MPKCTITIDGGFGGRRTEISVNGDTDVEALSRAISLAIAAYGREIRKVVTDVQTHVRVMSEALRDA